MMNRVLVLWVVWLIGVPCLGLPTQYASLQKPQGSPHSNIRIRVLLDRGIKRTLLKTTGRSLYFKDPSQKRWVSLGKKAWVRQHPKQNFFFVNQYRIRGKSVFIKGDSYTKGLDYKKASYPGFLRFYKTKKGFQVINHLPLESYLSATLQGEMMPSWKMEALKAQAVASRTYALYMIRRPKNRLYDLEGSILDQVYPGIKAIHPRAKDAVSETRGQVLQVKGKPIKAFYHSRCGGKTANPKNVWNTKGYPNQMGVACPYCQKRRHPWKAVFSQRDFRRFTKIHPKEKGFHLESVSNLPSGRITKLKISTPKKKILLSTDKLRSLLGYAKLKSAYFDWKVKNGQIIFRGVGSGHGVGMCQWGAHYLARTGKSHLEILNHYYPKVKLTTL